MYLIFYQRLQMIIKYKIKNECASLNTVERGTGLY